MYDDGMPHKDIAGRDIVRVIAVNPNGWRYTYRDEMIEGDVEWSPGSVTKAAKTPPAPSPETPAPVAATEAQAAPAPAAGGWGDPGTKAP